MAVHDWTRVTPGIFHDFHHSWIEEIKRALNAGLLPPDYYALAEQYAGGFGPDVLTLQATNGPPAGGPAASAPATGTMTVTLMPPKVAFTATTDMAHYIQKQGTVVIRHSSGDRIIALVEVVSPGNKAGRPALRKFVEKAAEVLFRGYHLLILDLLPPGPRDPQGIHGAIWEDISGEAYAAPPDKPLTLAAYDAGPPETAYVTPVAVGEALPEMPLFLEPETYINVPLEATYQAAWQGVPQRWRRVLEGSP